MHTGGIATMALRSHGTTGVTGMLIQGETARNCTILQSNTGGDYIVLDNHDQSVVVSYDSTFAIWITQRQFVRTFKRLVGKAPADLTRVKLDKLFVAEMQKVNGKIEIRDHEEFIKKMDAPRSKAILAAFQAQETAASAAA